MRRAIIPAAFIMILAGAPGGLSFAATAPQPANAQAAQASPAEPSATAPYSIAVVPASQVVGRTLRDPNGADAGVVNSLIIDTRSGNVDFLVIGSSGSFDANGADLALPWQALQPPRAGNGPLTTKISASKILHSPRINPAQINELNQPGQRSRIYGYYGYRYPYYRNGYGAGAVAGAGPAVAPAPALTQAQPTMAVPAGGNRNGAPEAAPAPSAETQAARAQPSTNAQPQAAPNGTTQQAAGQPANGANGALVVTRNAVTSTLEQRATTSAQALKSSSVYDRAGQALGSIKAVMIDSKRGEVAYVLLSRGGFLGLQQRWYALPVQALLPAPYEGGYRLTANAHTLLSEPVFSVDLNNLPAQVDGAQLASLYKQFGVAPHWQQNGSQQAAATVSKQPQGGAAQQPQTEAAK